MPRIFLPLTEPSDTVTITGEKAHHLLTVLRCVKGDEISIFDGKGASYKGVIRDAGKKEVVVELSGPIPCATESPLRSVLVQGLLKGEKMDLVVQKATELGVSGIIPVVTERSQVRETRKVARWRKIAEEAAEQSGRTFVPLVHDVIGMGEVFKGRDLNKYFEVVGETPLNNDIKSLSSSSEERPRGSFAGMRGIIFWEEERRPLKEAIGSTREPSQGPFFVVVGPEGGFSAGEAAMAESRGLVVASLGRRILRAETAAITALALVQFLLGDLG